MLVRKRSRCIVETAYFEIEVEVGLADASVTLSTKRSSIDVPADRLADLALDLIELGQFIRNDVKEMIDEVQGQPPF